MKTNPETCEPIESDTEGWRARLELEYTSHALRTVISHKKHYGPLLVQKPFYPENEVCHTYLIHPPGGVVGGDRLELSIKVSQGSHALITTPAANKFYRSAGDTAVLEQNFTLADNIICEWLPQENILFDGSKLDMTTRINLGDHVRFIGWEMTCLGRPASGDNFNSGQSFQKFEIWQNNKPRLIERVQFDSAGLFRTEQWALANYSIAATMVALPADKNLLSKVRDYIETSNLEDVRMAATLIEDMLIVRGLGKDAETLRESLFSTWALIRPDITGKKPCRPRIWNT